MAQQIVRERAVTNALEDLSGRKKSGTPVQPTIASYRVSLCLLLKLILNNAVVTSVGCPKINVDIQDIEFFRSLRFTYVKIATISQATNYLNIDPFAEHRQKF